MAIQTIKMPQLGESVTEGTIEKWLVKPGDTVQKYDSLAEVNTDKVTADLPSSFSGVIKELIVGEGNTLAVGESVCTIETEEVIEQQPISQQAEQISQSVSASAPQRTVNTSAVSYGAGKARYSPAVLKLAQEHNIDLQLVEGTGAEGRITRKDVQKLVDSGNIPTSSPVAQQAQEAITEQVTQTPEPQKSQPVPAVQTATGDIEIPVTNIRKAIANNMLRSKHEAPHAWMMVEADVTNLVNYRDSIKTEFKQSEGYNITYFAFFVKAIAQALKEFPMMNSMWAGDKIIQKKDIHISIAVATEDALFVPVIKHADEKSIKGIAREINDLARKVRAGKLKSEDMQGGTFTVNNTGSFGSVQSMGIINYPQAAIIQVESIVKRPVIMNGGMFAARDIVNLCLSLDHRVLDGLICGKFLARVKEILENTTKYNTSVY
ncbi:dihydrolipoamide acetyltransferase family protein [Viridibacillus sp. NPDC093762]|uniref:dihydrolipoamide acetyltransferase family protein n=1 Tax=Viridibacillus sp. NPDC093762 TaxID=3390720 RepID=UPI003D0891E7